MTVHQAKGLSFPVDPGRHPGKLRRGGVAPSRAARGLVPCGSVAGRTRTTLQLRSSTHASFRRIRVAYVASTRARDCSASGSMRQPYDGGWVVRWTANLSAAETTRPGNGFRVSAVQKGFRARTPGQRRGRAGHGVSWITYLRRPHPGTAVPCRVVGPGCPAIARRTAVRAPTRRADRQGRRAGRHNAALRRYVDWRNGRDAALAGRQDALASGAYRDGMGSGLERSHQDSLDIEVTISKTVAPGVDRPAGVRYGTLVHSSLATVPLDANRDGHRERR